MRRVSKWVGVGVCALILLIIVATWRGVFKTYDTWILRIEVGEASLFRRFKPNEPFLYPDMKIMFDFFARTPDPWAGVSVNALGRFVVIPLWIPFLFCAAPSALLFWLDRRRVPPNHCRKCSYDLTGNVSGVCPECGKGV